MMQAESALPAPNAAPDALAPSAATVAPVGWIRRPRHIRKYPLSLVPPPRDRVHESLLIRAVNAVLPWDKQDYPGRWRAWTEITGLSKYALRSYLRPEGSKSHRKPSLATLEKLEAFLLQRRATLESAISEIEAAIRESAKYEATQRHGFCVVDPITKCDKRYRGRKGRKPK